jgi:hypothetical protein
MSYPTRPGVGVTVRPPVFVRESRAERIERVMGDLTAPVPSTKGMPPKDRANRLHAELERRIQVAKDVLAHDIRGLIP